TATTGAVTSVQPTSAVVTGTVNPNGAATTWYFEYGLSTSTSYGAKSVAKSAGSGTADVSVSGSLTGLAPATSYHYRVVATSSAGTTQGAAGVFNTSAAPSALTEAATHLTSSTATLNGIVNSEGQATSWYFEYGTSTSYGSKTPLTSLAASPNDTNVSVSVSNLAPRTTYHFRVVATSGVGTSRGSDLTLTTGLSVTLNASVSTITYSKFVNLTGTVASGRSGDTVTVLSERFDQTSFFRIAAVVTGAGGSWSYSAQPTVRTSFEVTANGGTSSPIVVSVRPVVYLTVVAGGRLSTRVIAASSFASHVLQFQRLSHGLWVTYKHVRLDANAKATFATSLPRGQSAIRMAIGPFVPGIDQASPGYLAGYSRVVSYHRA
ncbi:MAG: hypothetical protein JWO62_809, partial [Acidimicrobiaceae bacterium]|nr:hypothetical protein [Acidimicrobiaceae bacterium]